LINELKARGLWNDGVRSRLKMAEGSVQGLDELPEQVRAVYRTAWEVPMRSLIDMAADRGAFIDQSQSLNLFIENPNIGQLSSMYFYAWKKGIKTTYYLRSRPATRIAKATVDVLSARGVGVLASWEPWALLLAGLTGALLGQSAYSSGALSLSLPVIGTLTPIIAVVIGATVFGEELASAAWQLGLQLAGGVVAVIGIFVLSRSSIVTAEQSAPRGPALATMRGLALAKGD